MKFNYLVLHPNSQQVDITPNNTFALVCFVKYFIIHSMKFVKLSTILKFVSDRYLCLINFMVFNKNVNVRFITIID